MLFQYVIIPEAESKRIYDSREKHHNFFLPIWIMPMSHITMPALLVLVITDRANFYQGKNVAPKAQRSKDV
jgi:hypothetical protein